MKLNPHILAQFPESFQRFIDSAHEKKYKKGETIYYGEIEVDAISVVVTGRLRRIGTCDQVSDSDTYNDKGHDVLFEYLERGDVLGEGLMLINSREAQHDSMIEAETEVSLAVMGKAALARFKVSEPGAYEEMRDLLIEMTLFRLGLTRKTINEMVNLDAKERIRATLNRLCGTGIGINHERGTELRISRQDLALIVGCSREVAGRVVNDMKDSGYLFAKGKQIIIFGGLLPEMF